MKRAAFVLSVMALAAGLLGIIWQSTSVQAQAPATPTPGFASPTVTPPLAPPTPMPTLTPVPIRVDLSLLHQFQVTSAGEVEVPLTSTLMLTSGNTQTVSAKMIYGCEFYMQGRSGWVKIQAMKTWSGFKVDRVEWQGGGEVDFGWFHFRQAAPTGEKLLWCQLSLNQQGKVQEYCTGAWQGQETGENLAFLEDEVTMEVVEPGERWREPTATFYVRVPSYVTLWVLPERDPTEPTPSPVTPAPTRVVTPGPNPTPTEMYCVVDQLVEVQGSGKGYVLTIHERPGAGVNGHHVAIGELDDVVWQMWWEKDSNGHERPGYNFKIVKNNDAVWDQGPVTVDSVSVVEAQGECHVSEEEWCYKVQFFPAINPEWPWWHHYRLHILVHATGEYRLRLPLVRKS